WFANASGLTWIDREHVLFSEIKKGIHMAIVTSTESRIESRDVYVPTSENGMAHRSYLSPDRRSVLTAEMDWALWLPCRLLPFDGSSAGKPVGPEGSRCTSAAWSPDGRWMYLTVEVGDGFHIWRQRFPDGKPEQVTSGATEEDGVAMAPDGRSFVTSVGTVQSSVWMHDERGEHQLSFEGYSSFGWPGPSRSYLSADGRKLYYLSRQQGATLDNRELWSVDTVAKATERLLPEFTMIDFDVSADGKSVVFTTRAPDGKYEIWLASLERRSLPRRLSVSSSPERRPVFGPAGDIFFMILEPAKGAVYRMKEDGTEVQRVRPDAGDVVLRSVSPDGGWVALSFNIDVGTWGRTDAYPIQGGSPVRVCEGCRSVNWSPDGRHLYVSFVGTGFSTDTGRTFALPIPMGRALPNLPAGGINSAEEAAALPGVRIIPHGNISPGADPSTYAYTKMTAQRNLYRVPITD
ncbi:MAG TPA: hypothetical protein VLE54_09290, partial [Thermoanaerobaculia bacterium]|nr:hypothetical protein [Thermoanaerobaculia bacterium]